MGLKLCGRTYPCHADLGPAFPHRDTYDITARCRNIARSGENTKIARAANFASQWLEPKLPRTRARNLLFVGNTAHAHSTLHAMDPPPHSTFLWAHLPTDPAHGTLNGGRALHGVGPSAAGASGYAAAGITNISGVSERWPRNNFVSILYMNARANNTVVVGNTLLTRT